jgi:hypothetical protein
MRRSTPILAVLCLVPLVACDALERARGTGTTAAGEGITMSLEMPGTIRAGEESAIRIGIENREDSVVTRLAAELFLPAWLEPLPPTHEGAAVTMVASGEGTRLRYAVSEPALQPGETRTVVQRIRVPAEAWHGGDVAPSRTVRAWLVGPDGRPLGIEVSSELAVEGVDLARRDTAAAAGAEVGPEGVGALRLGMTAAEVRERFPAARDTTWQAEGTQERGLVVPLAEGAGAPAPLAARLSDGRIDHVRVRDRAHRTAQGLGVGSRLEELRAAYGEPCASGERGQLTVWFSRAPGISWVLDAAGNPTALARDPAAIPAEAVVRELFVRRGTDAC